MEGATAEAVANIAGVLLSLLSLGTAILLWFFPQLGVGGAVFAALIFLLLSYGLWARKQYHPLLSYIPD
jgi:hypothetical protein